jgi:Domain of unknown function (DUF4838)/Carbohydrate family 9 binding domain-like
MIRKYRISLVAMILAIAWGSVFGTNAYAKEYIVRNGKPQAEIVIAKKPTRTAKLASTELQRFIKRISGANLPIVNEPTDTHPIKIYVGRSVGTDKLKLIDTDLEYGAFRMASGSNWLAILGSDKDYAPPEPWARNPRDKKERAKVVAAWDEKSGGNWRYPLMSIYRTYSPLLDIWAADGRGSINGVYHFLKTLGVRWYFWDESGLIIPKMKDIALPKVNKVSRPDFPMRDFLIYWSEFFYARKGIESHVDRIRWQLWLGLSSNINVVGTSQGHGTMSVISRDEMKRAHPEYYAIRDGERAVEMGGWGVPCLSSEGLLKENVAFVRAAYDICNQPMYSVAPSDSYRLCECKLCKGKDTPARGMRGSVSDYVWDFTNRVAKELYKTHPDKMVQCIAYVPYQLPPLKIDKFSPNVAVGICQHRSSFIEPETREYFRKLRTDWLKKIPSKKLWTWDYYLHGWEDRKSPWSHIPTFFPRIISEDLKELKGVSLGDHIDIVTTRPKSMESFGDVMSVHHLNAYVTAACLWDADTDVDALLDEYYEKYYGPAAKEMKALIEYSEKNWNKAIKDYKVIDKFFELLKPAQKAAGVDTVYAKRVERLAHYMSKLSVLRDRLVKGREDAPVVRTLGRDAKDVVLDGKLDEAFWQNLPTHELVDVETGQTPQWGTTFRTSWSGDSLYIGIVCRDRDTKTLDIKTRAPRSPAVWDGDNVEILLETQTHAYYQIAVNPAGSISEADRRLNVNTNWSSGSQIGAHIGKGYWSVEIRIPAAGSDAASIDPTRGVSGTRPTKTYPWYINICRQRNRLRAHELTAFSPTGLPNFHKPLKFGMLHMP